MIQVGVVMNVLGLIICMVFANTLGPALFQFREFPEWAQQSGVNSTDQICADLLGL